MEFPVILDEKTVGTCVLEEAGLYWMVQARCALLSDRVERLYSGIRRIGVLEREGDSLVLRRRISRSSCPELPPKNGVFSLRPMETAQPWSGAVLGQELTGFRLGDTLLFPYDASKPCPCEPLFCFFAIKDGFWRLQLPAQEQ